MPVALFYLVSSATGRAFVLAALQGLMVENTEKGEKAMNPISEFFWLRSLGALCASYASGVLLQWYTPAALLGHLYVFPLSVAALTLFGITINHTELNFIDQF